MCCLWFACECWQFLFLWECLIPTLFEILIAVSIFICLDSQPDNLWTASASSRWETLWAGFYVCRYHQSCSIAWSYKEPWSSEERIYCTIRTGEDNIVLWHNYECLISPFQTHFRNDNPTLPFYLAILFASLGWVQNLGKWSLKSYC